jgi:hypothetical protein
MAAKISDKMRLLATASSIAARLKDQGNGNGLRIRSPRISKPATDGWRASIGDLGKNRPRLEIWLDRFSGHSDRKFLACFYSADRSKITGITRHAAREFWPVRTVTLKDTTDDGFFALSVRLDRSEFTVPILEKYRSETFFGVYDPTRKTNGRVNAHFCERAVGFFLDVARSLPTAEAEDTQRGVYPACENRKLVAAHLARERSRYLAAQCKQRDDHRCQVCDMTFAKAYGETLGAGFAEAHHLLPFGKLPDRVKTQLADLITVCANCHRMLHRMEGKRGDVGRLRAIVGKCRRRG